MQSDRCEEGGHMIVNSETGVKKKAVGAGVA